MNVLRDMTVVDSLAPRVTTDFWISADMKKRIIELSRSGIPRPEIRLMLARFLLDELQENPDARTAYMEVWRKAGVDIACTTCVGGVAPRHAFLDAVRGTAVIQRLVDILSEELMIVTSSEKVKTAIDSGRHGIILNLQNGAVVDDDLDRVDIFWDMGARILQLTYNCANLIGSGCTDPADGGLTRFGRALVGKLNERHMMIDLSHCGPRTTDDAIEASKSPVSFTHTFSQTVCDHPRGKTDDQIRKVAKNGGYVGLLLVPGFLQSERQGDLSVFIEHLEHLVEVAGIDSVGIGTDTGTCYDWPLLDGATPQSAGASGSGNAPYSSPRMDWRGFDPEHRLNADYSITGYQRWTDWPNLVSAMSERGFSEDEMRKILGLNFLRVFSYIVG